MFKSILKSLVPPPVWHHVQYYRRKILKNGFFALDDIDKKMLKYINFDTGYFVELGANDGFTQSNTLAYENKKGWRGVLIEPNPHLFLSCCYYRGKVGNAIHCCACVPFDYTDKYVDIEYANLMSRSASLNSDIQDLDAFNRKGKARLNAFAKDLRFGAVARTLTSVLDESNAPHVIDFMSLDVEGAERAVLGGLDFDRYSIRYLLVECRDVTALKSDLAVHGYALIDQLSKHDYLFAHQRRSDVNAPHG